jgi:hypothetical protein
VADLTYLCSEAKNEKSSRPSTEAFINTLHGNYFPAKKSFTFSLGTISSLKEYAPVLGDFIALITLVKDLLTDLSLKLATVFLAMT